MQKIIRTLLKDSIKIHNLPRCSTLQNHVNFSQDNLACKLRENYDKHTDLQNVFKLNNDPKIIVKTIQQTYKDMDINAAVQAMNNLKDVVIKDETFSKRKIKNSDEFIHMCQLISSGLRTLPRNNVIAVLDTLLFFEVSVNSSLLQLLLQLIRTYLNDLSVGQIILLYELLKNNSNATENQVPLIKSICIALPKVFQQRAQFELDEHSHNLINALRFSCSINDMKTKLYIIDILYKHEQNIQPKDMKYIFYTLSTLDKFTSVSLKLLNKMKNKIKTNYQSLNFVDIKQLLNIVSAKVANGKMEFYSEEMVDALCSAVLNHNYTIREYTLTLKYLNRMRHGNILLLDHLSSIISKDKDILKQCSVTSMDHFVKSLIIADYKPPNWESIQTLIVDFIKNNDYFLNTLTAITFRLLSLGCYCPELVEKVFIMYKTNYLKVVNQYTLLHVLKLYWCITRLYPEYTGVTIDKTVLDRTYIDSMRSRDSSFLESLEMAVGNVKYIMSDLKTKCGEFIEHVIVIQPNGLPMDISNYSVDTKFVEELDVPSECSKILLFSFPKMAYSINKRKILNTVLLPLKAVETVKGYHVILIDPYLWKNLSPTEEVSYLRQAIKSKCNNANIPQL